MALTALTASAEAATTYLRPNEDVSPSSGWSPVGGSAAWETLDDSVTESETPNASDYISNSTYEGTQRIGLRSIGIAGATSMTATAWFYMASSEAVQIIVREGRDPEHAVASGSFSGTGWHSVNVSLAGQAGLDSLLLEFKPVSQHGAPGPHKVSAAFLKLSYTSSASKLYWGAWMDGDVYTKSGETNWGDAPWSAPTWNEFQTHAGKAASIVHFGQPAPWNQKFSSEPLKFAAEGGGTPPRPGGAIPLMDMDADGVSLSTLNSGAKDGSFEEWAKEVAAYEKPFFLRWEWEMNLQGKESAGHPELFKSVWRRFHEIAVKAGAKNITWVWCPNVSSPGGASLKELYPGNAYVDWTCMDGYNRGTMPDGSGWVSFNNVFAQTYAELTSPEFEGHEKPIMIGETASTELGGSKSEWIANALGTYLPSNFPKIKAVLWFNWNIIEEVNEVPVQRDWQIESSPGATAAFANAISSPYYAANSFGSLPPLTRIQPLP
jgi:hypothetical protein